MKKTPSLWGKISAVISTKKDPKELRELEVQQLEAAIGYTLPVQYREFLLRNESQVPYLDTCRVFADTSETYSLYSFSIRKYLRIKENQKDDIALNFEKYKGITPLPNLMPIAFDQFRNIMLISLTDGKVYFWDKESRVNEDEVEPEVLRGDRLYWVADNFHKFEERLYRHQRFN